MKKAWLILALAMAGCAAEVTRENIDQTHKTISDLDIKFTNKNDLQVQLYNELLEKNRKLVEEIAQLQMKTTVLESNLNQLQEKIARTPTLPVSPGGDAPSVTAPRKPIEEIVRDTHGAMDRLRAGKATPEEVGEQLRPYAREAAPLVVEELRRSITKPDFAGQLETVLSKFPPGELKVPLQKALAERVVRFSAARVVDKVKDRELSKVLEEHAGSDDEEFRLQAGESLVACRNAAGIPPLVKALRSPERDVRITALRALKAVNAGEDFGFRAIQGPEQNAQALQSWEEWEKKFGPSLFD